MKQYDEKIVKKLQKLKDNKQLGGLGKVKNTKSELFNLKSKIFEITNFLPQDIILKERILYILNDYHKQKLCYCGKPVTSFKYDFCCNTCTQNNKDVKNKIKNIFINKYGVDNPSKVKDIKNKKRITSLQHYGVDNPAKSKHIQNKIQQTCLKKYGTIAPLQNKDILKKLTNTLNDRYGVNNPKQIPELKLKAKSNFFLSLYDNRLKNEFIPLFNLHDFIDVKQHYKFICKKCHNTVSSSLANGKYPFCKICHPIKFGKLEKEIQDFISDNIVTVNNLKTLIRPYELDIYLPEKKLAIEFNGLHWHSEGRGKDKYYHLNKTELCEEKNIRLIHIFEDEWLNKPQIVKNRLKNILGLTNYKIYGRKCTIKEIDGKLSSKFINKYHIQGNSGSSIKLGLFYKNRLVAVMTFGKRRVCMGKKTTEKGEFELLRYCTIANFNIIGGASKLLKYFERNYKPSKIVSYADRRWSQGNLYHQLGFKETHISKPNYWYIKNKERYHRFNFRKNVLKDKLEKFDENLTEYQNMQINRYGRIWDCGNYVFEKVYQNSVKS